MLYAEVLIIVAISIIKTYLVSDRFRRREGIRIVMILISIIGSELAAFCLPLNEISLLEYVMVAVYILTFVGIYKEKNSYGWCMFLFFLLCEVEIIAEGILKLILFLINETCSEVLFFWITQGISFLIIMSMAYVLKKANRHNQKLSFNNSRKIYSVLLFIFALIISFTVSFANAAEEYFPTTRYHVFLLIFSILAGSTVCFMILMAFYLQRINVRLSENVETEKELRSMENNFYNLMQEKEEETRKYRHDMIGHLIHLEELSKDEDMESLRKYIRCMTGEIDEIQRRAVQTGNRHFDVILNYYASKMGKDVKQQYIGTVQLNEGQINEYDLCTILSNLMQNVLEEFDRIGNMREKIFQMEFAQGTEYLKIVVRNTMSAEKSGKDLSEILQTSKDDKNNHGYGIQNITRTIQALSGTYENDTENEMFVTRIMLPTIDFSNCSSS